MARYTNSLGWMLVFLFVLCGCGQQQLPTTPIDATRSLIGQKKYASALAKCDELLAADPRHVDALLLRGETHEKLGDLKAAMEAYTTAIKYGPTNHRTYDARYCLYAKMAELETEDVDEKMRLQSLAFEDREMMVQFNPQAEVAFKSEMREESPILNRPYPKYVPPKGETKMVVEADRDQIDPADPVRLVGDNDVVGKAAGDEAAEVSDEVPGLVETGADYAARVERDAERIRELELGNELDEPTLPPHFDPQSDTALLTLPQKPVTRFSLPSDLDGSPLLPRARGTVSTGIRQLPETENLEEDAGPRNRFFLQNQFGLAGRSGRAVRTGIGSSTSTLSTGTLSRGSQPFRSGFLPPDAQDSFGPRLNQPQSGDSQQLGGSAPPKPAANSPILTTALPGSTRFLGGNRPAGVAAGTLSTARGGTRQSATGVGNSNFGPRLSDPAYTPFGARPSASATPTLPPPRTSN